jgi:hypothetical protein
MSDESTPTSEGLEPTATTVEPKAKKGRKRKRTTARKAPRQSKAAKLNAKKTAVLQLVTIAAAPRTATELANSYAGLREANLWPEQSVDQVIDAIDALVKEKVLKKGAEAPDGEPTLEIA